MCVETSVYKITEFDSKFYRGVITRSCLHLINTSISTFFSDPCVFSTERKEEGRPMTDKRKLDGVVDESSAEEHSCKSDMIVHIV